ncbi:MAG: ATP-binding protein [Paraperlucidibaca sp.]
MPTERIARNKENLLDHVLSYVDDCIIVINKLGIMSRANPSALAMFGYEADELLGQNISILMPDPYRSRHDSYLKRESGSKRPDLFGRPLDLKGQRKSGEVFELTLTISALPTGQLDVGADYVGIIRDISARKRSERLRDELLSVISHELRTPITAISGSLAMLADSHLSGLREDSRELLAMAQRNTARLSTLIDNLLTVNSLADSNIDVVLLRTPLLPIIELVLAQQHKEATNKGIRFEVNTFAPSLSVMVDDERLAQVLTHLTENAIKFSPSASTVRIHISQLDAQQVSLCICDPGEGVPDETLADLFKPFATGHGSDSKHLGGSGLGLAICQGLLQQMNCKIAYFKDVEQGSRFVITMPSAAA